MQCPPYISCILQLKDVTFENALKAIAAALRRRKWSGSQDKWSLICAASWHGAWQTSSAMPSMQHRCTGNPTDGVLPSICLYSQAVWGPDFQRRALWHLAEMSSAILVVFIFLSCQKKHPLHVMLSYFFNPKTCKMATLSCKYVFGPHAYFRNYP